MFTEVYADCVRLQDEYALECAEYDHIDPTFTAVLAQIEERLSYLYSAWCQRSKASCRRMLFRNNGRNATDFSLKLLNLLFNLRDPSLNANLRNATLPKTTHKC